MALLLQVAVSVISLWILIQQSDSITLTAKNSYDGDNTFQEGSAVTFSCKLYPYTGKQQWKVGTTTVAECGSHYCNRVGKRNALFSFRSDTSKGEFNWTINPITMEHDSTMFKCSDGHKARIITAVVLPLECKTCRNLVKIDVAKVVILLVHITICSFTKVIQQEKEILLPIAALVYEELKLLYMKDYLAWCQRCGDNSRYLPTVFGVAVALLDFYFLTRKPLPEPLSLRTDLRVQRSRPIRMQRIDETTHNEVREGRLMDLSPLKPQPCIVYKGHIYTSTCSTVCRKRKSYSVVRHGKSIRYKNWSHILWEVRPPDEIPVIPVDQPVAPPPPDVLENVYSGFFNESK